MSGVQENKPGVNMRSQASHAAEEELVKAYQDAGTGVFVGVEPDSKAALLEHLEYSLATKMDENVDLLQQLLEKEALYEQAQLTIKKVQAYVDECDAAHANTDARADATTASTAAAAVAPSVADALAPHPLASHAAAAPVTEAATAATEDSAAATAADTDTDTDTALRVGAKLAPFNPTMDACVDLALDMLGIEAIGVEGEEQGRGRGRGEGTSNASRADAGTGAGTGTETGTGTGTGTDAEAEAAPPTNPPTRTISAVAAAATASGLPLLYDLGCGDARLLVRACLRAPLMQCIGIEYDLPVLDRAHLLVNQAHMSSRVALYHDNVLNLTQQDLCQATYIFIYLVPAGMSALAQRLTAAINSGVRVVTYVFSIPGLVPQRVELYKGSTKLYLYCN